MINKLVILRGLVTPLFNDSLICNHLLTLEVLHSDIKYPYGIFSLHYTVIPLKYFHLYMYGNLLCLRICWHGFSISKEIYFYLSLINYFIYLHPKCCPLPCPPSQIPSLHPAPTLSPLPQLSLFFDTSICMGLCTGVQWRPEEFTRFPCS